MRVIDAPSLAKFVNREKGWKVIESYLLEGCITLGLAVKEVLNSIWKSHPRNAFTKEFAQKIMLAFLNNLPVKMIEQDDYLAGAIKISLKYKILFMIHYIWL